MPTFLTEDDPNAHAEFVTWIEANGAAHPE